MEFEFIIVTLISTIGGLSGLIFLSYRRDRLSDTNFDRKLTLMDKVSKIKMTEATKRNKFKAPKETTGLPITKDAIEGLISTYLGSGDEEDTDVEPVEKPLLERGIETVLSKLDDKTVSRLSNLLVDKYLGSKKDETQEEGFTGM